MLTSYSAPQDGQLNVVAPPLFRFSTMGGICHGCRGLSMAVKTTPYAIDALAAEVRGKVR